MLFTRASWTTVTVVSCVSRGRGWTTSVTVTGGTGWWTMGKRAQVSSGHWKNNDVKLWKQFVIWYRIKKMKVQCIHVLYFPCTNCRPIPRKTGGCRFFSYKSAYCDPSLVFEAVWNKCNWTIQHRMYHRNIFFGIIIMWNKLKIQSEWSRIVVQSLFSTRSQYLTFNEGRG